MGLWVCLKIRWLSPNDTLHIRAFAVYTTILWSALIYDLSFIAIFLNATDDFLNILPNPCPIL
jgi:hypothetical protein